MLSTLYPTIVDIGGVLADVPHDGYAPALSDAFADPAAITILGDVRPTDPAGSFVARSRGHWRDHGYGIWFLRDMETGAFAGWAGVRRAEIDGEKTVELAYALTPRLRCKGHATRVGALALQLGFENLGLSEIVAVTPAGDEHSLAVIDRLGFSYDRSFETGGGKHALFRRTSAMHAADSE